MRYFLFFILNSMLFFTCTSNQQNFKIHFEQKKGLNLLFFSKKDTSFIIDSKAFTNACYNKEEKGLIEICKNNIDSISCKIRYNQAILIDQNNDMRFFTDYFFLPNELKEISLINCMEDWFIKVDLKKGESTSILIDQLYVSDLMVTEKSSKIKIIYISKVKNKNNCASIIESNWIRLN